jgi:phage tail P2-like protein
MWKTLDIVPSSIRADPQVIAACGAIDKELAAMYGCMGSVPGGILFWPFVDQQTPPLLDILAWEMHVDVWAGWDGDLTTEQKVELINSSIDWHRHKGTKYAVEQMLKTVFRQGYVQEWYEYGGRPYFFRIVTEEPYDAERFARAWAGIMAVKNVRSWMEDITLEPPLEENVARFQMFVSVVIGQRIKETFIPVSTNPNPVS